MAFPAPDLLDGILPPRSLEALGIPVGLAEDLFMRRLLTDRMSTIGEVSQLLCISHGVGVQLAESLREKALVNWIR